MKRTHAAFKVAMEDWLRSIEMNKNKPTLSRVEKISGLKPK